MDNYNYVSEGMVRSLLLKQEDEDHQMIERRHTPYFASIRLEKPYDFEFEDYYISKTLQGMYADKQVLDWRSHLGQLYYARYREVPHGYISMKRHLDVNRDDLQQVRDLLDFRHQHLPRFVHRPEECGLLDAPSQVIQATTVSSQVKHSSHEELAADRIGESTGLRMGDIVETLFPEQLHLVRLAAHQPILLQGPAGLLRDFGEVPGWE